MKMRRKILKRLSTGLLAFIMMFALLPITNLQAATYPSPDTTVNVTSGMEVEILAGKTTTVKFVFDKKYASITNLSSPFGSEKYTESQVNYGFLTFNPASDDEGTDGH